MKVKIGELSEKDFESFKNSVKETIKEKDTNIANETLRFIKEVDGNYLFERKE